jgi:hypothetical protein
MSETKISFMKREFHDVRPNRRDLGFILIGLAFGLMGGTLFTQGDHHVFLLILTISLALTGTGLARKSL